MNNGGPAFPHHWEEILEGHKNIDWSNAYRATRLQEGMSLRDAFALAALTGIIAGDGRLLPNIDRKYDLIAKDAWELADAMLKQRGAQS